MRWQRTLERAATRHGLGGQVARVFTWPEVRSLRWTEQARFFSEREAGGVPGVVRSTGMFTVTFDDRPDARFTLGYDTRFPDGPALTERILAAVAAEQLPADKQVVDDGGTVEFGRVRATRDGLVVGAVPHPWAVLGRVQVVVRPHDRFDGSRCELRIASDVVPAGEVDNLMTLLRLVRARRSETGTPRPWRRIGVL